ncbi:MAG: hypothetical protein IT385_27390 [Deltaproteobacteria bacterium]|nr:hypothetical protein [Deltaproteobacteria bacterium]
MKRYLVGLVAMGMLAGACDKKGEAQASKPAEPVTKAEPAEAPKKEEPAAEAPKKEEPAAEAPKKEEPAAELPPATGVWKSVPNIEGLVADVPADAEENGVGGAAGFHKKDGSFQFALNAVADDRKAVTLEQVKGEVEQFLFKKWVKAEATTDGWVLVHEMSKVDDDGNEAGVIHAFTVRRMIGTTLFECSGGLDVASGIEASIASCNSVRANSR